MKCPECQDAELVATELKDVIIDICERCGGLWFDHTELSAIIDENRAVRDIEDSVPDTDENSVLKLKCPKCLVKMRHRILAEEASLERCPSCLGTWINRAGIRRTENEVLDSTLKKHFTVILPEK